MEKDKIFLGKDGLTMSSASHLRNIASIKAQELLKKLDGIKLTNKYVNLIGDTNQSTIQKGYTDEQVLEIPTIINKIAQYHSFEAWVNEAIKAKQRLFNELQDMTPYHYCEIKGIEFIQQPAQKPALIEETWLASLNIKERHRYYDLEAKASTIGKLIHKDGAFDKAIAAMQDAIVNPTAEILNGRDTILHTSEVSCDKEVVDQVFFALQKLHRSIQAELNGIKEQMNKAIKEDLMAKTLAFKEEYATYTSWLENLTLEMTSYVQEESQKLQELKIVIPDHLKEIYTELNA